MHQKGEAVNNQEYAEAVAKEMGMNIESYHMFRNPPDAFNPAEDWEAAGKWIECLAKQYGMSIRFSMNRAWITERGKTFRGVGETPLLALKAASEAYFTSKGEIK